jgi:sugar O-acyltransferase (sialic acid O-acetyltransferase NeuD family)
MKKVIIVGASGHSKVIIDIFEKNKDYKIISLIDTNKIIGSQIFEYTVEGNHHHIPILLEKHPNCEVFIAIGDNWKRKQMMLKIIKNNPNVKFANAIHPSAQIGRNVKIGKGVAIMAGVVINSDSKIGDFTIVNTKSSIDHDCIVYDFSSLAPNATTGSNVQVGELSTISISATIKHFVSVGKNSIIGASSLLMNDCADNVVMYGVPAKEIRKRKLGDTYL